ncbi:MAG: hypothetical protein CME71_13055 [Halobacteriovorax sp.]|nr:hypothetical protein [Halobacteriovorax sp.]
MKTLILLLAFAFVSSSIAACEIPAEVKNLDCSKTFQASTQADLEKYLENYGVELSKKGVAGKPKHLEIIKSIDLEGDIHIATPCSVNMKKGQALTVNGSLCVNSQKNIELERSSINTSGTINLESTGEIVIGKSSVLNAGNAIFLSSGDDISISKDTAIAGKSLTIKNYSDLTIEKNQV